MAISTRPLMMCLRSSANAESIATVCHGTLGSKLPTPQSRSRQSNGWASIRAVSFSPAAAFRSIITPQVSFHLNIEDLAAVADWEAEGLDVYDGTNVPGQPSTTPEELAMIPTREGVEYCPDLRLTQRNMEQGEWLVEGFVHNGGHWLQCVRTQKAPARREEKIKELAQRRLGEKGKGDHKGEGKGKTDRAYTAVAEHTYFGKPMNNGDGKGKNSSWAAVADDGRGWDGSWAAASSSGSWSAVADDSRGWDEWVLFRGGASSSSSWSAVADYGSGGITGVASNIMSPSSPLHLPQSRRN
jgi:hypothetical protein